MRAVALPGAIGRAWSRRCSAPGWRRSLGWTTDAADRLRHRALGRQHGRRRARAVGPQRCCTRTAGHIAVGWLVVEDVLTVLALVLLPALFGNERSDQPLWMALGFTALKVSALVAFTAIVGARVIPKVLDRVAATRSRELFTLTVLVIALGIAVGSARVFGVSMALGAFLAGMVVGRSDYSLRAASDALPMRDAFAVLFFVSVGMLLDPASLLDSPLAARRHAGDRPGRQAARRVRDHVDDCASRSRWPSIVAVALAQIGEFSFILSTLGRELGSAHARGDQHARRGVDRLDRRQPRAVPRDRSDRAMGGGAAAVARLSRSAATDR